MADTTIEWTDKTWNPVSGCSKVSPGCKNCYAETIANRFWKDRKFTDVRTHADRLDAPLHWKKPRRVFVNSMSDLFHEDVPDEFIDEVFGVMAACQRHTFQVLTKRALRMASYVNSRAPKAGGTFGFPSPSRVYKHDRRCEIFGFEKDWPLSNIWLGVSCENQQTADERIPLLLQTPAAVRFISAEPLLGPMDFRSWLPTVGEVIFVSDQYAADFRKKTGKEIKPGCRSIGTHANGDLDWVITGCESGPHRRAFDPEWDVSIQRQCQAAGVAFFRKQTIIGNKVSHDPAEWPKDWRVREYPAQ